ncbi:unnamed protein product, partial [Didymodactylos carnosus]
TTVISTASPTNVDSPSTNTVPLTNQDDKPNACSAPSQNWSISSTTTESSVNNPTACSLLTK